MWYSWSDPALFISWHQDTCALLGIPRPGRNASTGEIDATAEWTTSYTTAFIVSGNDIRAFVENEVALLSPNLLGVSSEMPPTSSVILDEVTS